MGYKRLMRVVDLCRGVVSQLNDGGYKPKSGWKHHIHCLKMHNWLAKIAKEEDR